MLTASQKSLRGTIGALKMHSQYDGRQITAAATAARLSKLDARLLAEVDPDLQLDPAERDRRLGLAKRAHYAQLAYRRISSTKTKAKR